jgi:hypothetical protein
VLRKPESNGIKVCTKLAQLRSNEPDQLPNKCPTGPVFMRSHNAGQHLQGLGAGSGLPLARSVLVPVLPCWWADVGAERFIRISEKRHFP